MLIKGFDSSTCYSSDPWGGYGMDWFDAMQCCYFQNSYLAEPQNQEETDKINTYLTISTGGDRANTWWMGATDMHHEGGWVWMSGNPWSYENWNEGEPNQNGNEDCGAFDSQADGFKVRRGERRVLFVIFFSSVDGPGVQLGQPRSSSLRRL